VQGFGEIVVPRPVLEEIAEDVKRVRSRCAFREEAEEEGVDLRPFAAKVQVGDE
jgi:hypothetical protein